MITQKKQKGDKFRKLANGLQGQIENKLADRETNTAKRLAQASNSRLEGEKLQRTQQALFGLADLHDSESVPDELSGFTSKAGVYDLMGTIKDQVPNGYHQYSMCTGEPYHTTPEAAALWSLVTGKTEEQKQAEELQRKIDGLQFSKIAGYFPTPSDIIDRMISYADIQENHLVCEPSAGSGAIADKIKDLGLSPACFETNHTLRDILTSKGHSLAGDDFMDYSGQEFDRIVMNPPFEKRQDIAHIKHAMKYLKPDGLLVAICSGGSKQEEEFQHLADHWETLPAGTFKAAGTNVTTSLLVIRKGAE